VSAKISEDEYISVGFKGQSWEGSKKYERIFPSVVLSTRGGQALLFWYVCLYSFDNFTSDRIALGYASSSGSCVREMVSKDVVGTPSDVD